MAQNDNNEFKGLQKEQEQSSLGYKEHGLFFDKYYALRDLYVSSWLESLDNPDKYIRIAFKSLGGVMKWTNSQISKFTDYDKLQSDYIKIITLIDTKQNSKALNEMDRIFKLISDLHERGELTPKVKLEKEDHSQFWRDEKNTALKQLKKGFYDILGFE